MDSTLSSLSRLTDFQKNFLVNGNLRTISDLILVSTSEIARRCQIPLHEATRVVDLVCEYELEGRLQKLQDVKHQGDELFTTGDVSLDCALGGGIRTGMVWEIAGESAAGKTQLALQLSLCVQLPPESGGLNGSSCYITIFSELPTSRLLQISRARDLLNPPSSSLDDVHTLSAPTIPTLIHVLSNTLPAFIVKKLSNQAEKPIKLVVIDAIAELFHDSDKTTTSTLVERSQNIVHISSLLHKIASTYQIAILVLNEVVDVFDRHEQSQMASFNEALVYNEKSQWFNTGHSIQGENRKHASLGLAWANQINTRILLTRTGRRRHHQDEVCQNKRRRLDGLSAQMPPTSDLGPTDAPSELIRRLTIIFSSVSKPASLDYIITEKGVSIVSEDGVAALTASDRLYGSHPTSAIPDVLVKESVIVSHNPSSTQDQVAGSSDGEEDWEKAWANNEIYDNVDWEALERELITNSI